MGHTDFPADLAFLTGIDNASWVIGKDWPARVTNIGTGDISLAERTMIKRTGDSCIYVHRWNRSDPDDLHDHPWRSCSLVLAGGYWETTPAGRFWREPGYVGFRSAIDRHRIEIDQERSGGVQPVSLLITGPIEREWGFHTDGGFVIGREYRSIQAALARRNGNG